MERLRESQSGDTPMAPQQPSGEGAERYGASNVRAVRMKPRREQHHISFKRYEIWFLLLCVGTLQILSLGDVCIRSPVDERNAPAERQFFLSVDLVKLLINGFETDLVF